MLLFMLFIFAIVRDLFKWQRICAGFGLFVQICIAVGDPIIIMVGIPLFCLTLPHFCACPKPGPGFPTSYVMVFFVFNKLR
jgi:hypothetical protein